MRECLSIVFNFLLSSPSFDYEDSDSENERFHKILSQKIELAPGLSHGAKIRKFINIRHVGGSEASISRWVLRCAQCSKSKWLVETVL